MYWIVEACRQAREDTGHRTSEIAGAVPIDQSTVTRWEAHRTRPRDPDQMVTAYSRVTGIPGPELWARALELQAEIENTP